MRTEAEQSAKRPYIPPKLLVYGNLTELTQASGNMHMLDGGMVMGMKRTG